MALDQLLETIPLSAKLVNLLLELLRFRKSVGSDQAVVQFDQ
jgi:hypothetical protein